jgi:hypothetical protein
LNAEGLPDALDARQGLDRLMMRSIAESVVDIAPDSIVRAQIPRCYNRSMTNDTHALAAMTDDELLAGVHELTRRERVATVTLIAALTELDSRRLYLGEGYSSLFTYCTQALHLSEHAAYGRIEAARAARRFPVILELLAEGAVTLTTICLLARHLTPDNHRAVLDAARHQSKREVEHQIAVLHPLPPAPSSIRKLPVPQTRLLPATADSPVATEVPLLAPATRRVEVVKPLAAERYKLQFTVSRTTHDKLRQAQDLLRHVLRDGDIGMIFDRALTLLLEDLIKKKAGETTQLRRGRASTAKSRYVPRAVRREVWKRDGGQCAFVGKAGRCTERGLLEVHHVVPFADDGPPTSVNLELRCRAHNVYEARLWFDAWR